MTFTFTVGISYGYNESAVEYRFGSSKKDARFSAGIGHIKKYRRG